MSRRAAIALLRHAARALGLGLAVSACLGSPLAKTSARGPELAPLASESVYFEVRPIDATLSPPQQLVQPILLQNGPDQSFVVPAPARVSGSVSLAGAAAEGAVLSFTAHGGIPNHPLTPVQALSAADGAFELLLPQGSYSLVAYPSKNTALQPPQYFADISTDADLPLAPLALWDPASFWQLTGRLVLKNGDAAARVQVSAVDGMVSSVAAALRLVSAPVLTGNAGGFTLNLPPAREPPGNVRLHVASGAPSGVPFPTLDTAQLFPEGNPSAGTVVLDLATATISGRVRDLDQQNVAGARVTVLTQPSVLGTPAPFELQDTTTTASDGTFSIQVYAPGDGTSVHYSVIAVPAAFGAAGAPGLCRPTSPAGTVVAPADNLLPIAAGEQLTRDLACDRLLPYEGFVRTADAGIKTVAGTRVTATLPASVDYPAGLTFQTRTDLEGGFALALPPGTYDFAFWPPESSGQPFTFYPARTISTATASAQFSFALLPPFQLSGRIFLGDSQHPLAAQVDAYQVLGSNTLRIASTLTRADGRYSLILPGSQRE